MTSRTRSSRQSLYSPGSIPRSLKPMLCLSCLHSQDHQEEADSPTEATVTRGHSDRGHGYRGHGDRGRGQAGSFRQPQTRGASRRFQPCRVCKAARSSPHVYNSHSVSDCNIWSKRDVEDLRVMMCEMKLDPDMFPDSASETEQD